MNSTNMQEISIEKNELLSSDVCSVIDFFDIKEFNKIQQIVDEILKSNTHTDEFKDVYDLLLQNVFD